MKSKRTVALSAMTSLVAATFGIAQPANAAIVDWQYWGFGDNPSYVVALTDPTETDYPYTASELVAAGEAYASFPLADGKTFADYEYRWWEGDEASCAASSWSGLGDSYTAVPSSGVIPLPGSYTGPIWLSVRLTGTYDLNTVSNTLLNDGSSAEFCRPANVTLDTAESGSLSINLTFTEPANLPARLANANIDISAYAFPAGTAVPSDINSYDADYPSQVGCTLSSCFIQFDAADVGSDFDFVYRAQWFDGTNWNYAPWDVARVAVSPGEEQQEEYHPPQQVGYISKAVIDISNGTNIGDTVGIAQDTVWDTDLPNEVPANSMYSWLYATTCDSDRWYSFEVDGDFPRGSTFEIPAEITIYDYDADPMNPPSENLSTSGLAFNLVTSFFNDSANAIGNMISQSGFEVGGTYCTAVNLDNSSAASSDIVRAAPYTGPVVTSPAISGAPAGGKVTLAGSNLKGISAVEIDGLAAVVSVNSDGEIEITIPAGLAAGTYDLVITSDSGKLTIQDGITVSGTVSPLGVAAPSTKRMVDNTAKVWVFDVAGAGKVQIFLNGEEIAWVRTDDPSDAKLKDGYLVRTVELVDGKNVIEIYVDGERVRRTAYTK